MEKIVIFDVPASIGGAVTILNYYYEKAIKDFINEYVFIVSNNKLLLETNNVKIECYPWIKRSIFHRAYFELFTVRKILTQGKYSKVISLQNFPLLNKSVDQTVYLHNRFAIQLFSLVKLKSVILWLYNIMYFVYFRLFLHYAKVIVVQTETMKRVLVNQVKYKGLISVERPSITNPIASLNQLVEVNTTNFIYPSSFMPYKNHYLIVKALEHMDKKLYSHMHVYFTFKLDTQRTRKFYRRVVKNNLPIQVLGHLEKHDLYEIYKKSNLIFSSVIESLGLPLLEGSLLGMKIICINKDYAKDVLCDYNNVEYFEDGDYQTLSQIIENTVRKGMK